VLNSRSSSPRPASLVSRQAYRPAVAGQSLMQGQEQFPYHTEYVHTTLSLSQWWSSSLPMETTNDSLEDDIEEIIREPKFSDTDM